MNFREKRYGAELGVLETGPVASREQGNKTQHGKKGGKGESCRSFRRNIQEWVSVHRISQVGPGWAGNLLWDSVGSLQPEDGRKSLLEIAEIELSLVFSPESNGSKWVEMG